MIEILKTIYLSLDLETFNTDAIMLGMDYINDELAKETNLIATKEYPIKLLLPATWEIAAPTPDGKMADLVKYSYLKKCSKDTFQKYLAGEELEEELETLLAQTQENDLIYGLLSEWALT